MNKNIKNLIDNACNELKTYKCCNGDLLLKHVLLNPDYYKMLLENEDAPIAFKHRIARCLSYAGYKVSRNFSKSKGDFVDFNKVETIINT